MKYLIDPHESMLRTTHNKGGRSLVSPKIEGGTKYKGIGPSERGARGWSLRACRRVFVWWGTSLLTRTFFWCAEHEPPQPYFNVRNDGTSISIGFSHQVTPTKTGMEASSKEFARNVTELTSLAGWVRGRLRTSFMRQGDSTTALALALAEG